MQLNNGIFEYNNKCGYLLKPDISLLLAKEVAKFHSVEVPLIKTPYLFFKDISM